MLIAAVAIVMFVPSPPGEPTSIPPFEPENFEARRASESLHISSELELDLYLKDLGLVVSSLEECSTQIDFLNAKGYQEHRRIIRRSDLFTAEKISCNVEPIVGPDGPPLKTTLYSSRLGPELRGRHFHC